MRLLSQAGTLLKRPGQAAQNATYGTLVSAAKIRRLRRLTNVILSGNPVDHLAIGHSWTEGARVGAANARWIDQLKQNARTGGQLSGTGFGFIPSTATYTAALPASWVCTGTAAASGSNGGLGNYMRTLSPGDTASLTFTGTAIDLYSTAYSGGPSCAVTIDGGAVANFNANSSATNHGYRQRYSGLTAAAHTIVLTMPGTGGTLNFNGAAVFNGDEATGWRTYSAGHGGQMASDFITTAASTRSAAMYQTIKPSLVTIEFAVNEYRLMTRTPATMQTDLASLVAIVKQFVRPMPSIVFILDAQPAAPTSPLAPWADYVTAYKASAEAADAHLFDCSTVPELAVGGTGWDADLVHPNTPGNLGIGRDLLADLLAGVFA